MAGMRSGSLGNYYWKNSLASRAGGKKACNLPFFTPKFCMNQLFKFKSTAGENFLILKSRLPFKHDAKPRNHKEKDATSDYIKMKSFCTAKLCVSK